MTEAMQTPAIQYTVTSDGMQIAYAIAGEGAPLVLLPFHFSHILLRWHGSTTWFKGMTRHFRTTHYDSRGQGLSTRGLVRDPTVADYRRDLDAVIEAAGVDQFSLMAYGGFGHVALRYAVEHPERVTALVLICTCESFSAWTRSAFLDVAEENWDLFLELQTRKLPPAIVRQAIAAMKGMVDQEDYVRMVRCFLAAPDVTDILPLVTAPTMLVHALDQHWLPPAEGAALTAKIPGARILFVAGDVEPHDQEALPPIISFLQGAPAPQMSPSPSGIVTSSKPLSARQLEVLRLISEGKRTREIAEDLTLSDRTVERHIAEVYAKIGARNRAEATAFLLSQM